MRTRERNPSYLKKLDEWANSFRAQTLTLANGAAHAAVVPSEEIPDFSFLPEDSNGIKACEEHVASLFEKAAVNGIVVFENPALLQVTGYTIDNASQTLQYIHIDRHRLTDTPETGSLLNGRLGIVFTDIANLKVVMRGKRSTNSFTEVVFSSIGQYHPKDFFIATAAQHTPTKREFLLFKKNGKIVIRQSSLA